MDLPAEITSQLPQTPACIAALGLAFERLPRAIFNHSLRVFLAARWLADREKSYAPSLPLLFIACICHDLGASDEHNGPERFEVEGADAASKLCKTHGISSDESHKVWTAIALHTSPGIAERIDAFTRLVRCAVKIDFSADTRKAFAADEMCAEMERLLPRLDVERVLSESVVGQAGHTHGCPDSMTWHDSKKFPRASWSGVLLRAKMQNPGYDGINPAF